MRRWLPLVALASLLAGGCGRSAPPAVGPAPTPAKVEVARVQRCTVVRTVELPGDVRANRQAQLFAKVSGYLDAVLVDKGDRVQAGQLLARISLPEVRSDAASKAADSSRGQADVSTARARVPQAVAERDAAAAELGRITAQHAQLRSEVTRARAGLQQAQAERALAKETCGRLQSVYDEDAGLLARQDLDVARTAVRVAESRVQAARQAVAAAREAERAGLQAIRSARSRVTAAGTQIDVAESQVSGLSYQSRAAAETSRRAQDIVAYTEIRAPFRGTVTQRWLDPGALVQNAEGSAQGATRPILALADFDVVRVVVQVPQEETTHVGRGTPAVVHVDAWPKRPFRAPVARASGALEPSTRTMLTEVDVPNRDHALKPGMFVKVDLEVEAHAGALAVPTAAVLAEKDKRSVFVVDNGHVKKTPLKVGFENAEFTEVLEGLKGGEEVVASSPDRLADGAAVRK